MTDSFTDLAFANVRNKEVDYNTIVRLGELQGIDVATLTTVRNIRAHNKTLLHLAAGFGRKSWVRGLIANGCAVDAPDDHGNTPLHAACYHDHKSVALLLIQEGADVNRVDNKGWPALLHVLSRQENANRIQADSWRLIDILIFSGADPYLKCVKCRNSFERIRDDKQRLALRVKHILKKILTVHDRREREAIIDKYLRVKDFFELVKLDDEEFFDCLNFYTEAVERSLKNQNIDPSIDLTTEITHCSLLRLLVTPRLLNSRLETCDNITPLHRAAGYGHLEVAKVLIKLGAKPNATDRDGRIPLHNAAMYGHIDVMRSLAEGGSDVNMRDLSGYTPLHVAAESEMEGSFISCLVLIELGAKKDIRSLKEELPYDLAKKDEVKKVLALKQVREVPSTSGQGIYIGFQEDVDTRLTHPARVGTDPLMLDSGCSDPLFSSTQHTIKKVEIVASDAVYQLLKQQMLETIVNHANDLGGRFTRYEILRIEKILHKRVWSSYRLACQNLENKYGAGSKNEKLLFHGSNYIDEIQTDGFDERYAQSKGMFGAGLYFAAHSSKSNQYAFGLGQGCEEHKDKSCYICERKMIYAQVALGRSKICREAIPDMSHAPPGFNSVTGLPGTTDGLVYPEYVIYNGDQAYPLYVITYRIQP